MSCFVDFLTHDQIAEIGAAWVRRQGYPVSFSNMRSTTFGEQPDVLGFNPYGETFLLEAKTSRADFFADSKKPWRSDGLEAIGDNRGYITTKGLLSPNEIPYGWWLLEVHGKTKPVVKIIKGKKMVKHPDHSWPIPEYLHCDKKELYQFQGSNKVRANNWLIKLIQRAIQGGVDMQEFAQAGGSK